MLTFSRVRGWGFLGLMAGAFLFASAATAADDEAAAKKEPQLKSFEFERSWVFPPPKEKKPTMEDVQPIPDERSAIYFKEFGRKVIEPMPEKVNKRREKDETQTRKLSRGLSNVFLGWLEIPYQVGKSTKELDPISGALVGGLRGVAYTGSRMVVGAYEVVTFWNPRPAEYKPVIEPEFVLTAMWGDRDPYFADPYANMEMDLVKNPEFDMQFDLAREEW